MSVSVHHYHTAGYHDLSNITSAGFWQSGVHLISDFQAFHPFSHFNNDTGGIVSKLVREPNLVRRVGPP